MRINNPLMENQFLSEDCAEVIQYTEKPRSANFHMAREVRLCTSQLRKNTFMLCKRYDVKGVCKVLFSLFN